MVETVLPIDLQTFSGRMEQQFFNLSAKQVRVYDNIISFSAETAYFKVF